MADIEQDKAWMARRSAVAKASEIVQQAQAVTYCQCVGPCPECGNQRLPPSVFGGGGAGIVLDASFLGFDNFEQRT